MHATLANSAAVLLAATVPMAFAQTYTDCNPMDTTCPDDPAMGSSISSDFTAGASSDWTVLDGTITYDSTTGAAFVISQKGDAPTIQTSDYFFFGTAEVVMQAAPGTGIVSTIVLESDDLDEIDWEALGSYGSYIETDYFGKGYTGSYNRSTNANVDTLTGFHTYTLNWQKDSIEWLIDGTVVRTLTPAEAGDYYPQTPMRMKVGIWAGGDPSNPQGTITWAGGETNYSDGPFTMYVKSVSITNANPGSSYTYSDHSGSDTSIVVNGAESVSSASTSVAAATTSSTTSTAPSSTSTSSSSSTSSAAETTTSAAPTTTSVPSTTSVSTAVSTKVGATTTASTTFSSVVSTTPSSVSTPTTGLNTTTPARNSTATGTGSHSSTSTSTSTTAPQVGAAASVTSSAVALYCVLFALVAYAL